MAFLTTFMQELKTRKVRKTIAIYTSTGLTLLGVTNLFSGVYHLPRTLFDCILVLLICGFPSACILAWYHGAGVKQKARWKELLIHSVFFMIAALIIILVILPTETRLLASSSKAIAVLPFRNLSDSKEDEYFSDGMTEDIITQLSKISHLQVISRTSVMKFKNSNMTIREIGHELNVPTILEGTVRRAGNRVSIVGRLIDAATDVTIWGATYDRDMQDIFAIQSEVAQSIAGALKATLSPEERKHIEKKSTENLDAYAFYLRGREYYYLYTKEGNERAIELFKKALALDPHFALAYAGLGIAYDRRQFYGFPAEQWTDSAIAVSNLAISLDPSAAEGYNALGNALYSRGEYRRALELYTQAATLNPSYASAFSGKAGAQWKLDELDGAIISQRKAVALQPGFPRWSGQLAFYYFQLGYDSLTMVWSQKTLELQPDYLLAYLLLGYVDVFAGRFVQAREQVQKALSISPDEYVALVTRGDVEIYAGNFQAAQAAFEETAKKAGPSLEVEVKLAYVLRKLGNQKRAERILDSTLSVHAADTDKPLESSEIPHLLAVACAMKGDTARAIRWLRMAFDLGDSDPRGIRSDPLFEDLYANDQFKMIAAENDRKVQAMRKRVDMEEAAP